MTESEEAPILPRDKLLRDTFTPAELMTFVTVLVVSNVAFWAADPRSYWILGFFIIVGGFTVFILKTHERTHPFFIDMLWPRFWLLAAPAAWSVLQFIAGIPREPVETVRIAGDAYLTLRPLDPWLPVTTSPGAVAVALAGLVSVYLLAVCLFLVPKSRYFFERLFPVLCLSAVLVCVFGYIQTALGTDAPIFTRGTGAADFFAFFTYDGHWAAFAALWCAACTAMTLLSTRYEDSPPFIHSVGPWYLTGAILLGASGWLVDAKWPAVVLLLAFALLMLLVTLHFVERSLDQHRNAIASLSGITAATALAAAIFRFFQSNPRALEAAALRRTAADLFHQNPLFGWGFDAFHTLAPFYADDRLLGAPHARPPSDILLFAAEFGLAGCAVPLAVAAYLLLRYLKGRGTFALTNHLLLGCGVVLVLALCDSPFMSPAVFVSFFVLLFTALRWADLSRGKVDEVDARPTLVTHPSQRRVPFYTGPQKEVFK